MCVRGGTERAHGPKTRLLYNLCGVRLQPADILRGEGVVHLLGNRFLGLGAALGGGALRGFADPLGRLAGPLPGAREGWRVALLVQIDDLELFVLRRCVSPQRDQERRVS